MLITGAVPPRRIPAPALALALLGVAVIAACSSGGLPHEGSAGDGAGGLTGVGGDQLAGAGGSGQPGLGGAGGHYPGSCDDKPSPDAYCINPDLTEPTCTVACCNPCGIEFSGWVTCSCDVATHRYSGCVCAPPSDFPVGLHGGPCVPQGYSAAVPAEMSGISLERVPCNRVNVVCFTANSLASSERGCICKADGVMHCGSVNHWFVNDGVPTPYNDPPN